VNAVGMLLCALAASVGRNYALCILNYEFKKAPSPVVPKERFLGELHNFGHRAVIVCLETHVRPLALRPCLSTGLPLSCCLIYSFVDNLSLFIRCVFYHYVRIIALRQTADNFRTFVK